MVLFLTVGIANAQDTKPTKEETVAYINKIVRDANSNFLHWKSGNTSNVYSSSFSNELVMYGFHLAGNSMNYVYNTFDQINWNKAEKINDSSSNLLPTSPVKFLAIKFPENSILRVQYYNDGTYERQKENKKNFSEVYITYLDQEGVRDRLVKAIEHLIDLSKKEAEEEKQKDPFAN